MKNKFDNTSYFLKIQYQLENKLPLIWQKNKTAEKILDSKETLRFLLL